MSAPEDRPYTCGQCRNVYRKAFPRCPRDGGELAPLEKDPLEGVTFATRYIIEKCVGEGAMGRVYKARHVRIGRKFAIKVMFGDLAADPKMRSRFEAEAKAASLLDHPNVISVVDSGETPDGLLYLVMDFVEGKDLADLSLGGPMPEAQVVELLRGICQGLQHAHDRGIIHRDLKLENVVVVDENGQRTPRIVDFGIARLLEPDENEAKLTAQGCVVGTPAYMSPEQACGEKLDPRSDLFSIGLITYELLAGKKPFDGTPLEIARKNVSLPPPRLHDRNPNIVVNPGLEAIVSKMLEKRPEQRQASAAEVLESLEAAMNGSLQVERKGRSNSVSKAFSGVPLGASIPWSPPDGDAAAIDLTPTTENRATTPARMRLTTGDLEPVDDPPPERKNFAAIGVLAAASLAIVAFVAWGLSGEASSATDSSQQEQPQEEAPPSRVVAVHVDEPKPPPVPPEPPPPPLEVKETPKPDPKEEEVHETRRPSIRKSPPPKPPKREDEIEVHDVSVADFRRAYMDAGEALNALERSEGKAAAEKLAKTYRGISFNDAMKNPSVRRAGYKKLLQIQAELAAR